MAESAYSLIPPDKPDTIDELVDLYNPVVEHFARHYYREYYDYRQSLNDLRQDTWIGILKAWNEYVPGKGMTFKTFAVQMARWWLLNAFRFSDKALFNAWRTDRDLYLKILHVDSLDKIRGELGDHFDFPALVDEPVCSLPFQYLLSMIRKPRLRYVLEQYYLHGRAMDDIGIELGISRERIRQIMNQAYELIRAGLEKKKRNPFAITP
jgi:DNA-directed RNA polymerase specialized sigma subunit